MNQSKQYVYGQSTGQGEFKAANQYQQTGPKVTGGHDKYDNYGQQGYDYKKDDDMSCCAKCCACIGATICCCCVLDCLT